jgi:hypothetical protein
VPKLETSDVSNHVKRAGTLHTERRDSLSGTFVLDVRSKELKPPGHQSVDGKFSAKNPKALIEVRASGYYSVLEDDEEKEYVVKLLDDAGFFHVVR